MKESRESGCCQGLGPKQSEGWRPVSEVGSGAGGRIDLGVIKIFNLSLIYRYGLEIRGVQARQTNLGGTK